MAAVPASTAADPAAAIDVFGFITSMTEALAWPIAFGLVVLVFHREIKALLPKLASLKAAGVEASFSFGKEIDSLAPLPAPSANIPENQIVAPVADESSAMPSDKSFKPAEQPGNIKASALDINDGPEFVEYINLRSVQAGWDRDRYDWLKILPARALNALYEARLVAKDSPSSAVVLAWRSVEITARDGARKLGLSVSGRHTPRALLDLLRSKKLIDSDTAERYLKLQRLRSEAMHSEDFSGTQDDALQYLDLSEELAINIAIDLYLQTPNFEASTNATN